MVEAAAMAARCGTTYQTNNLPGSCTYFGKVVDPTNITTAEKIILDKEWNILKNMYLSEKQKVQQKRDDDLARATTPVNAYNGCIGNDNYNPYTAGMVNYSNWLNSLFHNPAQSNSPCGITYFKYYINKEKRFYPASNRPQDNEEQAQQNIYLQTGQTPLAIDVQNTLSVLAQSSKLTSTTNVPLKNYPEFSQNLYKAMNGGTLPATFASPTDEFFTKTSTVNTEKIKIEFFKNTTLKATLYLDKTSAGITNWSDIKEFAKIKVTGTTSPYAFEIMAALNDPDPNAANYPDVILPYIYKKITGDINVDIKNCIFNNPSTPYAICTPNDFSIDISNLMSALLANSTASNPQISSTTYVDFDIPVGGVYLYKPYITENIKKYFGSTNSDGFKWKYVSSPTKQYELSKGSTILVIKFTSFTNVTDITGLPTYGMDNLHSSTPAVRAFSDIKIKTNTSQFIISGIGEYPAASGIYRPLVTINGDMTLTNGVGTFALGKCQEPAAISCKEEPYLLKNDLEKLLTNTLTTKQTVIKTQSLDLTLNPLFSDLISSYIAPNIPLGYGGSKWDKFSIKPGTYREQVYFNFLCACSIILWLDDPSQGISFSNIQSISNFTPIGPIGIDNNYYNFSMDATFNVSGTTKTGKIFGESCLPLRACTKQIIDANPLPTVKYTNPCVTYVNNINTLNAQVAYKNYKDSLITVITRKYNQHCLGAVENFKTTYDDKQYHFTLYYYDQAGNLVKTIPPEGVNAIILSADDNSNGISNGDEIKRDKTGRFRKSFFTKHTMATTYTYNSLGQLVRQNMPDQDMMNVLEYTLLNALESRLKITATYFATATNGYLTGNIESGTTKFGCAYTTEDGGTTWSKINNLVAADFKKVQMIDATNGYAVAYHGIILKTTDGGNSWVLLPPVSDGAGNLVHINDLFFTNATNGVVVGFTGIAPNFTGFVSMTKDGGNTFGANTLTAAQNLNVQATAVTYANSNLYITANTTAEGRILKAAVTDPTGINFAIAAWNSSTSIRTTDLVKIQMLTTGAISGTTNGYAIGKDGTLLFTTNGGTSLK